MDLNSMTTWASKNMFNSFLNIGLVRGPNIVLVGPNTGPQGIITCMANQIIYSDMPQSNNIC